MDYMLLGIISTMPSRNIEMKEKYKDYLYKNNSDLIEYYIEGYKTRLQKYDYTIIRKIISVCKNISYYGSYTYEYRIYNNKKYLDNIITDIGFIVNIENNDSLFGKKKVIITSEKIRFLF